MLPLAAHVLAFRQAARKAERVMRHLSENYPTQSSTGGRCSAALKKAQGKRGAARLNRQLSRDGDKGALVSDPLVHSLTQPFASSYQATKL